MSDFNPAYMSEDIRISEWAFGCEITKNIEHPTGVLIRSPDDAKAIIDSLNRYLDVIPKEFGGNGE